jgi:hypothetical protein
VILPACHGSESKSPDARVQTNEDGGMAQDASLDEEVIHRSSPRLRAVMLDAEGMPPVFSGWHDTKLDTSCTFRMSEDGLFRCLPSGLPLSKSVPWYVDAACSRRAATTPASCAPGEYQVIERSDCPGGDEIYRVTALPAPTTRYRLASDGTCSADTGTVEYALDVVAPSEFASAKTELSNEGRLRRSTLVTEDGAMQLFGTYDADLQGSCDPFLSDDWRCVPTARLMRASSWFLDAACLSERLTPLVEAKGACSEPKIGVDYLANGCGEQSLFSLSKATSPAYEWSNGTCQLREAPALPLFQFTPLTPDGFPLVTRANEGAGRLRPSTFRSADLLLGYERDSDEKPVFEDTLLKTECTFWRMSSGELRCVPTIIRNESLFTDPACTQQVFGTQLCRGKPNVVSIVTANTCNWNGLLEDVQTLRVGAEVPKPAQTYIRTALGECMLTQATPAPDQTYFELTDPVGLEGLAAFVERME